MYIPANLVFRNYVPSELKEGMLFITERTMKTNGGDYIYTHVYEMNDVPLDEGYYDEFYKEHGYPVHVEIYAQVSDNPDDELVLVANEENIGWIEQENQLYDFTLEDMNAVMMHYSGMLGLYMEEDETTGLLVPVLEDGMVVVTCMDNIYQDYDEEY
jgi:hypothetical protein